MAGDDQTPATKKDLQLLEERLVQHFNVVAENLVHDFKGIFEDRLEQHSDRFHQHEGRIQKLESAITR